MKKNILQSRYRTHTCGELRAEHSGQTIKVAGWIHRKRDHGGILFIDLRDNYGVTQLVVSGDAQKKISDLRVESVIGVTGVVTVRPDELKNAKLDTGAIEVHVADVEVHSSADVLPLQIAEPDQTPENIRLKYRFLELRREELHKHALL